MTQRNIKVTKEVNFNDEALISNADARADVVRRITEGTSFAGQRQALKLLNSLKRKAKSRQLELEVAKIADEIACLIICEPSVQWAGEPWELREALPYLEEANRIEKRFNHLMAMVAVRKTLIATMEIRYGARLKNRALKKRGQRHMREGMKAMQNCDISQLNLARLQYLLGCIQWCNDNAEAGDAEGAADHLVKGSRKIEPTIANIASDKIVDRRGTW